MADFRDPTQDVIRNMRALREAKGVTAQRLADGCTAVGVPMDRAMVSKLERGFREKFTVAELAAFAHVLGVSIDMLLGPDEICAHCAGLPPAGYECLECHRRGDW